MHHSCFIFVYVIAFALCENAGSTDSGNGNLPVAPELPTPQNGTVETQKPNDEKKLPDKGGDSIPKDSNVVELKQTPTKTTTNLNPDDLQGNKNEVEALNKNKLKLKLFKLKADMKENSKAATPNWENLAKNLQKIHQITNGPKIKKYMPFGRNSREEKDYTKTMQILEWFYNGRPLLANETRLWANMKSENKADKDPKDKSDSQAEKNSNKSDKNHKIEAEFHTIEAESKEKKKEKQRITTKKSADMAKTADAGSVKEESTTTTPVETTNDSEDSDSDTKNGLHIESANSKEAGKAKMSAKIESETDMTSEETIENVTVLSRAGDARKEKVRTVQRFAPMKDGPSSSESTSVS
ncbi:uncharacterized protein isoform X2 [Choristoneura fumiferana]|uniref:uncharacterized protein isoform X2 n=1 Tax=Choristoneura fumiferana TaxID=7141 RepID=UPI003D155635